MSSPIVVTHSDIAAFLRCRRSWAWGFMQDLSTREVEWGALALGSRVHAALEAFYRHGTDPAVEHQRLANEAIASAEAAGAPPWGMDTLYQDIVIGRNCIDGWKMWMEETGADHGLTLFGVEEMIEMPILGGAVTLRGKVDRLMTRDSDGAIIMDDWKTTGQWHAGLREKLERSYQHHVYLAICRHVYPTRYIAEANYTVIKKSQRNMGFAAVERFRVPGTTRSAERKLKQIEFIVALMLEAIDDIKANGMDHAVPSPDESCRWCNFKQPCEIYDDAGPEAAEALLHEHYIVGRKHARYEPKP